MKFLLYISCFFLWFQIGVSQDNYINIELEDSTLVTIDSMIIVGTKKVKDVVVYGESRLKQGQKIPLKKLREELLSSRQNLLNTRLFNDVEILIFKWTNDNHVSIEFLLDERWYIYPIPIVELTGLSVQEWKDEFDYDINRLTYGMDLDHFNLTGNADVLNIEWRGGFQKQYAVNYRLTGVDKKRNWGLGGGVGITQNKGASISATNNTFDSELFDEFVFEVKSANLNFSRRRNINRRHGLFLGANSVEIADTLQQLSPNFFENDRQNISFGSLGYFLVIENRDLSEYPTNGEYLFVNTSYSGFFEEDYDQFRMTGNFNFYRPISDKFFASAGLHARYTPVYQDSFFTLATSRTDDLQVPRGYNDFQIFPMDYAVVKSEVRYQVLDKKFYKVPILPDRFKPLPLKIYPKMYFDIGKTNAADFDTTNPLNDDLLYSYGVGLDLVTIYNTPFLIDLSRNHIGETNLNFGIGKSF